MARAVIRAWTEPSITVHTGSDYQSITHLLDPEHIQSWCGWQYQDSVVRVDGCTSDASFVQLQLDRQLVGGFDFVIETGHVQRGPWWLHFGLFAYADSSFAARRGDSLESERARRQLRATGEWSALSGLGDERCVFGERPDSSRPRLVGRRLVSAACGRGFVHRVHDAARPHTALGGRVRGRVWASTRGLLRGVRRLPDRRSSASRPAPRRRRQTLRIAMGSGYPQNCFLA